MKFTMLEIDPTLLILSYIIGAIFIWAIIYYTIKAAVKNGILESRAEITIEKVATIIEKKPTAELEGLKQRYDKGQISFEEYQKEWTSLTNS